MGAIIISFYFGLLSIMNNLINFIYEMTPTLMPIMATMITISIIIRIVKKISF